MRILIALMLLAPSLFALDQATKERVDAYIAAIRANPSIAFDAAIANPYTGMRPLSKRTQRDSKSIDVTLQGVLNKKALINGELYEVGHYVAGYRLESVTEKGITLSKNGQTFSKLLAPDTQSILLRRDRP